MLPYPQIMNQFFSKCLATAIALTVSGSFVRADAGIIAKGAKLELVSDAFKFTEGPAVDKKGQVYFTDQPNDRIVKLASDGTLSTYKQPSGRSNGMYFDRKGNLIACADEKNELWSIAPDGKVSVLLKGFEGKLFNGPNDVWVRPDNGLYFTDPLYKRPYWKRGDNEQGGQHVYYLGADRTTLIRVANDLKQPNGIIGTPDGKTLYVSDLGAGKTYSYSVQKDGSLLNKILFCNQGSDGMTVDRKGNVYLTGKGVTIFNEKGVQIEQIQVPEPWTANVCFGGASRKTLYITAGKSLYRLHMNVRGHTK